MEGGWERLEWQPIDSELRTGTRPSIGPKDARRLLGSMLATTVSTERTARASAVYPPLESGWP